MKRNLESKYLGRKVSLSFKFTYITVVTLLTIHCWANPFFYPTVECHQNIHNYRCPKKNLSFFYLLTLFGQTPPVTITSLANHSILQSGFLVGKSNETVSQIYISLDNGPYTNAILSPDFTWRYQFPSQAVTGSYWKLGSKHTITVQAENIFGNRYPVQTLEVEKGTNKDTNGDGFPDVFVSASPSNAVKGYGLVYHSKGNEGVLSDTPDTIITDGLNSGSYFGDRINTGDFNGDGYADMIIGAQAAPNTSTFGYVYIFHSSGTNGILSQDLSAGGSYSTLLKGQASGNRLGSFVTARDTNNDGYDDAISSSPWNQFTYIFHSNGSTGVPSKDLSQGGVIADVTYNFNVGNFSNASTAGDINNDGYMDLVVPAQAYNTNQGEVFIFMSNAGVLPGTAGQILIAPTSPGPGCNSGTKCSFGGSIVLADFNGDACKDLAVGGTLFNTNQGITFIYHSTCDSVAPYSTTPSTVLIGPSLSSCKTGTICNFGAALSAGDTNGDGYSDLLVGANNAAGDYGAAYLFQSQGAAGIANTDLSTTGTATAVFTGSTISMNFGFGVTLSDITGDGLSDVIVASPSLQTNLGQGSLYYYKNNKDSFAKIQTLSLPYTYSIGNTIALQRNYGKNLWAAYYPISLKKRERFFTF